MYGYVHTCIHLYLYIPIHMHGYISVQVYICICIVCIYINVYIWICTYMYIKQNWSDVNDVGAASVVACAAVCIALTAVSCVC